MYPHQREAFEFMWRNLAGGIELGNLKRQATQSDDLGGCVISHAPGTGKTRLAIVFIQSYVKAFPNCNPVIFAPASIMQTWETEFKKWDFDLPFHNMNSEDFTGKENAAILEMVRREPRTMQLSRTIKLCSWVKENSVLGMSYDLFREYVLGKSSADSKERDVLLTKPGLIVLDEGHTPRNDRSRLWKAFNEVKTEKRIILSGTPFQNTFLELHNTLCLVRPRFAQRFAVPSEMPERAIKKKKLTKDIWSKPTKNVTDENADEVRSVLKPFVHVHAGDILKSLPGLRECVIMLNPEPVQREAIQNLGLVKNSGTFDSEYKTSIASIHPFLLTSITKITEREASLLNMDLLENLRCDPYSGVKTKFVVEFVRLLKMDPLKEKVLIFSQYIEPLNLIKEQLMRIFQWTEGTEVLHIYGKILTNERQRFINSFNDKSNKARVLLASTKACSEGISLTGASRVIMLDVVWNPAVGKQAISRAFRIGQERVVYTYNLITAGTGEMEKYDVQGKKDKLSKLVFSPEAEAGGAGFKRGLIEGDGDAHLLVAEDWLLENLTSNDKLKGMFAKIYYIKSDD
jgi:DNA repair and recombination protein RAD54 and RAD54-like protein